MGKHSPRVRLLAACAALAAIAVVGWQVNRWLVDSRTRQQTEAALEARDFSTARRLLDQRLRTHPRDGDAMTLAAQAARRLGEFDDAAELLKRAERAGAPGEVIELERALGKVQTGEMAAIGHYLDVATENPDLPVSKLLLEAIVAGALARLDLPLALHAAKLWDKSAVTAEAQALSAEWQGEIAIRRGEAEAAAASYRRAIELSPTDLRRLRLADLLARQNPTEALGQLDLIAAESAGRSSPNRQEIDDSKQLLVRARCQRALGDDEQADSLLNQLLARQPAHYEGLVERGQLALELRRNDVAETCLRAAVAIQPQGREALQALARCLQLTGKADEAREIRERVAQLDQLLNQRIRQLQQQGKIEP